MFDQSSSAASRAVSLPAAGCTERPEEPFGDVSGVVLAHLLARALADVDAIPDTVTGDAELVDIAIGLSRLEAWAVAQRARVAHALVQRTHRDLVRHGHSEHGQSEHGHSEHGHGEHGDGRGTVAGASHRYDDGRLADRVVSTELSLALGITPWMADRDVELGAALARHRPLGVALAAGRLDRRRAELVLEELAGLDDVAAQARVLAAVVGDGRHDAERDERRAELIRPLRRPGSHLSLIQPAALRRAVRHECAAQDVDQFAVREARARAGRRVELQPLPDCMAELRIVAPGFAVAAAMTNLDLAARACRRRGDGRTLDQLRSDIAVGWLTEGAFGTLVTRPGDPSSRGAPPSRSATPIVAATPSLNARPSLGATPSLSATASPSAMAGPGAMAGPSAMASPTTRGSATASRSSALERALLDASGLAERRSTTPTFVDDDRFQVELPRPPGALIVITMSDRTGLGISDGPATLHGPGGPGPLPAPVARWIAHDPSQSTWLGLYTDPRTGVATDISPSYRPPPGQRTFVVLRDGMRSRLPSSNVRRVELDHVVPYDHDHPDRGGRTTPSGLVSAGLREHHLKTDGALTVSGDANGPLSYTTRSGHRYLSWPEVWDDPPSFVSVPARGHKGVVPAAASGDPPY